jgi:hypothetical protein
MFGLVSILSLLFPLQAWAMVPLKTVISPDSIEQAFREYIDVSAPSSLVTPGVVDVPIEGRTFEYQQFLVVDRTTGAYVASQYLDRTTVLPTPVIARVNQSFGASSPAVAREIVDRNIQTHVLFGVPIDGRSETIITLEYEQPITASRMSVLVPPGVMLPETVRLVTEEGGIQHVVINTVPIIGNIPQAFPKTRASRWIFTFVHSQPLSIQEILLENEEETRKSKNSLRFVAEPGHNYRIYANPDRYVVIPYSEAGNYSNDQDVVFADGKLVSNDAFRLSDIDQDQIPDVRDNCPNVANPMQEDKNLNGKGDSCEDFDRDGVMNDRDNCPSVPNFNQLDTDNDGIGDACDGEESRITEKYRWVPWVGMGTAGLVIVVLFVLVARKPAVPEAPESTGVDGPSST